MWEGVQIFVENEFSQHQKLGNCTPKKKKEMRKGSKTEMPGSAGETEHNTRGKSVGVEQDLRSRVESRSTDSIPVLIL